MIRIHRKLAGALCAVTALLMLCSCGRQGDTWKSKVGESLPSVTLKATDGSEHNLADKKGSVALVAIFGTWCPPCRQELPDLDAMLYKPLKDKGVVVYAVNAEEDAETVRGYAKSSGLTFPILMDEKGEFTGAVGGSFFPRSIIIDKQGKIRSFHVGYDPTEFKTTILPEIEALLKES